MAQRVHIVLEDDIDGGEATSTVVFALDGTDYEIDLSDKNAAKLRDAFSVYTAHARKAGTGSSRRRRSSARATSSNTTEIRAWASENGYQVSSRGRVSGEIREAYDRAHKS